MVVGPVKQCAVADAVQDPAELRRRVDIIGGFGEIMRIRTDSNDTFEMSIMCVVKTGLPVTIDWRYGTQVQQHFKILSPVSHRKSGLSWACGMDTYFCRLLVASNMPYLVRIEDDD